jgi:hypothetical protein
MYPILWFVFPMICFLNTLTLNTLTLYNEINEWFGIFVPLKVSYKTYETFSSYRHFGSNENK